MIDSALRPGDASAHAERASGRIDFGLLGHPANFEHLWSILRETDAVGAFDSVGEDRDELSSLFEAASAMELDPAVAIPAPDGVRRGELIVCPFLPERLETPARLAAAREKVVAGCRLAASHGARIVGLGGFTSIVAGGQGLDVIDEADLAITSGNTLTAGMAVRQLNELFDRCSLGVEQLTVAVVGATGDIGIACSH